MDKLKEIHQYQKDDEEYLSKYPTSRALKSHEYITYLLQLVETQAKALAAIEEELVDSEFVGDQRIIKIIAEATHI